MNPLSLIDKYFSSSLEAKKYLLIHSYKVAEKALEIALNCNFIKIDKEFLAESALLHDIGIIGVNAPSIGCNGSEPYIKHGMIGFEILLAEGFPMHARVCKTHIGVGLSEAEIISKNLPIPHENMLPESIEEKIVCFADKFYSKSEKYLLNPKPIELICDEMKKYGEANYTRFEELRSLFNI
ncbi:MAG: HD domain-containing protein [Bacteroidota bacterium]